MKESWYLLLDNGNRSLSYTLVVISFAVITLWLIAFIVGTSFNIPIPPFDATSAMAYFSPIAALYGFRKADKRKKGDDDGK